MIVQYVVAAVLTLWLALTVLLYLPSQRFRRVLRFDVLRLIPRWQFFGPEPPVDDATVWFRATDRAGRVSPWQALGLIDKRSWLTTFWRPFRRVATAYVREQRVVWRICETGADRRAIEESLPFGHLFVLAAAAARREYGPDAALCEIRLTRSRPRSSENEPRTVLESTPHPLPN